MTSYETFQRGTYTLDVILQHVHFRFWLIFSNIFYVFLFYPIILIANEKMCNIVIALEYIYYTSQNFFYWIIYSHMTIDNIQLLPSYEVNIQIVYTRWVVFPRAKALGKQFGCSPHMMATIVLLCLSYI